MSGERLWPPAGPDERAVLHGWLLFNRQTVEIKCEGLDAEQLTTRSVEPSPFSLIGLVRHLHVMEVSRLLWFGDLHVQMPYLGATDFEVDATVDVEATFAGWRADCERGDQIIEAAASLEDMSPMRPNLDENGFAEWDTPNQIPALNLRYYLTNLNYEYARHSGHLDLLRERIDGRTGY